MQMGHGRKVPGFPQGMMDMQPELPAETLKKLTKKETRGMRSDWHTGVQGLMTVVRVLPPELYEQVMQGEEDLAPGVSISGKAEAKPAHQEHQHGH